MSRLKVVEPDVQLRDRSARDDIARVGRGGGRRELEIGRGELLRSIVEVKGIEGRDNARQRRNRVLGAMRVGNMTLDAGYLDPHVHGAATPDFNRVAEAFDAGRFANEDHVRPDLP